MSNVDKWFEPLANVVIAAALAGLTLYMTRQVEGGTLPWWPYPALFALCVFLFAVYARLTREEG